LRKSELNVFDKGRCPALTHIAEFDDTPNSEWPTLSLGDCDREASPGSHGANV
jgi:hypothetical protein